MNFIFSLLLSGFFLNNSNAEIYKSIQACVFQLLRSFKVSSLIECAVESNSIDSEGFIFENQNCILYEYWGICQCDSLCHNKTIFVNEKHKDKVRTFPLL